jgi:transposase
MKKYNLIVGIDISKNKLDVCLLKDPESRQMDFLVVSNDSKGIRKILAIIKKNGIVLKDVLFCFENTGVYGMTLACYLHEAGIEYWEVPAIEIKRAKGISRGKNDKTDAKDIAYYAHTHLHKLKLSVMPEKDIVKLRLLFTEREKLLKSIQVFEATNEIKGFIDKDIIKDVLIINRKTLKHLYKLLLETENKMQEIIRSNQVIKQQNELIQTIPGVGPQTAIYLIIATKCFRAFDNWRQMACYAGVAPFEYSSGSSIKGRTKVNHLADKKMKALLTMCALNAKKHDKEISMYYHRKVKEGKKPILVMNAIKCKVLSRVFAIIHRGQPWINTYKFAA